MACPISFGEAISAVQTAYAVFKAIKEAPGKVNEVGHRLATLQSYLGALQDLVTEKAPYGLAAKRPALIEDIKIVSEDVKKDAGQAEVLLSKFKDQMQFGFEWKYKWVANAIFTAKDLGKLEDVVTIIDGRLVQIDHQINLLNGFGIQDILAQQHQQKNGHAKQGGHHKAALNAQPFPNHHKKKHSPSPSPAPSPALKPNQPYAAKLVQPPQDQSPRIYNAAPVNVIFIDPMNQARSVVASAYLRVLKQVAENKGNNSMPIHLIHSAGLRVRAQSDVKEFLANEVVASMREGGDPPNTTALESLFEHDSVRILPFAEGMHQRLKEDRSRGITSSLFIRYDYIIVFEEDWVNRLLKVKLKYLNKFGPASQGKGTKGQVVNLAMYGSSGLPNIMDGIDPKQMSGEEYRRKWDEILAKIAGSINGWLKKELGWEKAW